jgi:hypothetical protein
MKFWKKSRSGSFLVLAFIGVLSVFYIWSCYPDSGLTSASDFDLIITQFDPDKNFSTFVTYIIADSIEHIVGEGEEDNITREYDEQILARVIKNMNDLNYQRVTNPAPVDTPDIGIKVYVTSTTFQGWSYYPGWWGGWWGGYPPGWGPYYPGYMVPYEFSTGTVLIDMLDLKKYFPAEQVVPTVWGGGISGLLGDTKTNIQYRLERNIDQCFRQSPYLGTDNK